ncbi:hypothetical protein EA717_14270 [Acinetobacter baumannii]|nr:hypothetical protein EGY13_00795 [Acinetobacter sp. FDAARGOS_493]RSP97026.1 hypothetical protein EA717_14270 [Acinetobacter baumannii]
MGRGAGPRAGLVRLALAGEVQGGRLHVLPCADEIGVVSENGIYGHSRFCNTDFDDKLACLNLSGV